MIEFLGEDSFKNHWIRFSSTKKSKEPKKSAAAPPAGTLSVSLTLNGKEKSGVQASTPPNNVRKSLLATAPKPVSLLKSTVLDASAAGTNAKQTNTTKTDKNATDFPMSSFTGGNALTITPVPANDNPSKSVAALGIANEVGSTHWGEL